MNYQVGQAIKAIREFKEITLSSLASSSGISKGQLSKIENGNDNIKLQTLFAISKALQVMPESIIDASRYGNRY